ncbi:MAG: hypothetical protein A3J63_02000 [Candidatus Moranbacteria bacterium RIFCSPHIGHO2_02_FULL_40_12b]|nr:MAG: hypothetical protein A3J63_02000 [Candidatus Moranbacteria bacterium RIFCSPHIGHO2_02_FULL_40_12b]
MNYKIYPRLIAKKLIKYLSDDNVIVLHGARQVGKSHILFWLRDYLKSRGKAVYYIDLEDSRFVNTLDAGYEEFANLLREEGMKFEKNKIFVFIDEIQYLKNPSSFLKLTSDHYKNIKLIVSGSSSFEIKNKFKDSLVGRTVNFEIFNLSFEEFLLFKGISFAQKTVFTEKKINELKGLFEEYALYGGYPKIVLESELEKKEKYLQQIIDTYVKKDIRDLAGIKDVEKFNKLLEALASQSGNLLNVTELSNTCKIAKQTVERYLFIMENTYILKLVRPYSGNIRAELFKLPKIYFYDSGLMQLLWLKNFQKTIIGNVFETAIFSELIKRYGTRAVFYWRTADKKEIDFILKDKNKILPIEAKLNFEQHSSTAIDYFNRKYKKKDYRVVSLNGRIKNRLYRFPWEII